MQQIEIGKSGILSSRFIYGCMRTTGDNSKKALKQGEAALEAAVEAGYTHFDHADIYARGASESLFGKFLNKHRGLRKKLVITGKVGIRPKYDTDLPSRYDFSASHLMNAVEGSLERLGVDQLDMLLLHRPDYLMDANEVAEVFMKLKSLGRVKSFGVSNFTQSQMDLLQSRLQFPLETNQIEINLHNYSAIENGMLDYCQQHEITPQAWCPLGGVAYPAWGNTMSGEDEKRLALEVDKQAKKYDVDRTVVPLLFLLKHPAKICPIIGSTKAERIRLALDALKVDYSREDWYRLLEARRGHPIA